MHAVFARVVAQAPWHSRAWEALLSPCTASKSVMHVRKEVMNAEYLQFILFNLDHQSCCTLVDVEVGSAPMLPPNAR